MKQDEDDNIHRLTKIRRKFAGDFQQEIGRMLSGGILR